jgi:hypothetical protein
MFPCAISTLGADRSARHHRPGSYPATATTTAISVCTDVTRRNGRACAVRLEAAALRRDIAEAQDHIDRPQRRYLSGGDEPTQQRPAGEQSPAMVDLQAK